jgi:hypothetical protein
MAQTGFTPIQIYRSSTASAAPTSGNLVAGELAINTADGKLFYLDNLNAVQVIGWKLVPVSAGGTGVTTSTGTGSVVLSNAPSLTGAVIIGGTTDTATLTLGRSTASQTVNIATGATDSAEIKTVNIATNSPSAGTTVNIGSGVPESYILLAGQSNHNYYSFFQAGFGQEPILVNDLPTSDFAVKGDRNFVSNANSPRVGSQVTSGGTNTATPVFYDGTNWICDSGLGATTGTGSVVLSTNPTISDGATIQNTSQAINIGTTQSTGAVTVGGTSATGALTLGQSTGAQTVNIATGNNTTTAKSVNIGTGGSGSSATTIEIGTATGGATTVRGGFTTVITTQSNEIGLSQTTGAISIGGTAGTGAIALGRSTGAQSVSISGGATTSGTTKTVSIGTGGLAGSTTTINMGATASAVTVTIRGLINVRVYTVATLPAGIAGSRAFVSDALAPVFGSIVASGGAVNVPVYHDGTNWRVG